MCRKIGRILYHVIDTVIVVLCLPFYAVCIPLIALHGWAVVRFRQVRVGMEVVHWPAPDVRDDLRVVDVSRLGSGLVGVHRRSWNVLYNRGQPQPAYPDAVEFCTLHQFWLGYGRRSRSGT